MKWLVTIALFVFWAVFASTLAAGLVFYQKTKDINKVLSIKTEQAEQGSTLTKESLASNQGSTLMSLTKDEVAKHNKASDCWMTIDNKIYNFTSYMNQHPGGPATITPYCGKDGTSAFVDKPHSKAAFSMLTDYYVGALNSKIAVKTSNAVTNNSTTPKPGSALKPVAKVIYNSPTPFVPTQATPQVQSTQVNLTTSEVANHSSLSDCWMIVSGKVYNVTSYIPSHPGGSGTIAPYCGKDATSAFSGHSQNANNILGSYYIGDLNSSVSSPSSSSAGSGVSTNPQVTNPVITNSPSNRRGSRGDDDDD